jgi:hypothetical protein
MAVMHGNLNFEFVWEILPIQPTIQPRELQIDIKNACRNNYSRDTKKLDVTRCGALHCVNLRQENRIQKFPSVLNFSTHF